MKRVWMPLYINDYLGDTTHLGALESGAYMHLIMAYWLSGGRLPQDDRQLATIAKMSVPQWRKSKATLAAFFGPGWASHTRIDKELKRAAEVAERTSERGKKGADARWHKDATSIASSTEQAMPGDAHSPTHSPLPKGIKNIGEDVGVVRRRKTPPHGATGRGRIWISAASTDWPIYAEDFFKAHKEYPKPDPERGGKWFLIEGEGAKEELRREKNVA